MAKKEKEKPLGKFTILKFFRNKRTGQISVALPKKKMPEYIDLPKKIEVTIW